MKYCTRCGLPETYSGIWLDDHGVCNFCHFYENHRDTLENYEELERLFISRLEAAKAKAKESGSKYDCLVGLSGGKDSTYIIYQLKHKYNMRILAFTYDNGFATDYGRQNVITALENLDIDHISFSMSPSQLKRYNRACVKMFHNFCMLCFHFTHYYSHLIASEKNIPLIVNGRTKGQVLQSVDQEKLIEPFERSICFSDFEYQMFGDKVEKAAKTGRMDYLKDKQIESLSYFMYHPYDAGKIMDFLEAHINWKRPAKGMPHADCWAHAMAEKYHLDSHGYPIMTGELAVMVRSGELTLAGAKKIRTEDTLRYQNPDEDTCRRFQDAVGI